MTSDDYRTPLPCETRTYELTGYTPHRRGRHASASDLVQPAGDGRLTHVFDSEIHYEDSRVGGNSAA